MSVLRTTSVRRTLIVLALLVAVVAAFEVYAWSTRHNGLQLRRGGSTFALAPTPEPSEPVPATAAPDATRAPSAAPGSAVASPSSPAEGSAAPVALSSSASQPVRASRHTATPITPRAGTYQLAVDGKEKVDFGPVSFCSRALPARTTLVVAPAQGEPAGSYDFDIRYFPGSAGQHDERHIYRYDRDQVVLSYENATVSCGGVQQASQVDFNPPQVRVQLPLRVGARWSTTTGDSDRTEDATSQVLRTEPVRLAGAEVATYVIETTVRITGSETGSRLQRWWYAPSLALPVKWFEHIDGSRSGATYSEDATVTVVATP
jgi:hypothetical protein